MSDPTTPPAGFKGPRKRRPKSLRGSLTRTWLIRLGIALGLGLAIGAGIGVTGVNILEPGQPAGADSLQMVLDSITRGTTPIPAPRDSAPVAPQAAAADTATPATVSVPDLVGVDEGGARSALEDVGLTVAGTEFRASRSPAGTVLATVPVFGSAVARGSAVTLVLSDGRAPVDSLSEPTSASPFSVFLP